MKRLPLLLAALHLIAGSLFAQASEEIVVASYNVQNYVTEESPGQGRRSAKAKSEESISALVRIVKEINPDVLGVCEMGSPASFEDFKKRLREAGVQYTDFEYVEAADSERRLALLSKFPIVARQSVVDASYELNGAVEKVLRGFLDVTVRINPEYDLRLVGAHLKSKLSAPQGEALMRRFESQLLRKHIEEILQADPQVNLIAYGDFNDTKNEASIQEIMGSRGSTMYMADLWAEDRFGDRWTHYWRAADLYSRFDYLFVSPALFPEVVKSKSRIYRSDFWDDASDHRPVYTSIVPRNRSRR